VRTLPLRARQSLPTSASLIEFLRGALDRARQDTASLQPIHISRLHRLEIQLLTRNQHYADLVRRRVYGNSEDFGARERCRVAVLSPEDSSLPPPPAWGEPGFYPREIENLLAHTPLRVTFFHDLRIWQIYDHDERFGLLWLAGPRSYCDWEPGAPLRVFLHWASCFQDMRLTHAGVLGKDGAGVLLAGKGGSGKSGTVVGGIAHGLQSVGDDYVLVEATPDNVTAYPLFQTLKQDLPGLRRLGLEALIAGSRSANWQDKYEFTSREIGGQPLAERLPIRAIVVPRIADVNTSKVRPVSPQRAMLALAPTGLFQLPGERDSGVRFFTNLVRRLPCFELALSHDPADVARTLGTFLAGDLTCV
jgi:hypothetical protein